MSDIIEEIREAGYQKGQAQATCDIALKMIADGEDNNRISHLTDLTDQEIDALRSIFKKAECSEPCKDQIRLKQQKSGSSPTYDESK